MIRSDAELRQYWLKPLARGTQRRFPPDPADEEAAEEWFFEELRQMAERLAATAHLGPPPDKDDRSIAERLAAMLYLPMTKPSASERRRRLRSGSRANRAGHRFVPSRRKIAGRPGSAPCSCNGS
jgi:hypothetical protein